MAQIDWKKPADGMFSRARDWSGGAVPGPSSTASLGGFGTPYTVIADRVETVQAIELGLYTTLSITAVIARWLQCAN